MCVCTAPFQGLLGSLLSKPMQQVRFLDLHEYQSKALMAKFGVRVQVGDVADTAAGALAVAKKLKGTSVSLGLWLDVVICFSCPLVVFVSKTLTVCVHSGCIDTCPSCSQPTVPRTSFSNPKFWLVGVARVCLTRVSRVV